MNISHILLTISWYIITIILTIWHIAGLKALYKMEAQILSIKEQIDSMTKTQLSKSGGNLNQSQLDKIVEHMNKPLIAKMETLKLKRQFLLDKLPLLSFFKKA